MLMNNLDPEVAEDPDHLVVYGGTGRAARSWAAFDAIVRELRNLADDETLLVQSGKPVGVVRTHEWAPRVLIANSNLVGKWATWDVFRDLERQGLMMYGQMTAGIVDLHRDPGDPPGHLRDVRGARAPALRRDAAWPRGPDRRARWHGRGPAVVGHDERRRVHRDRGGRASGAASPGDRLRGRPDPRSGRGPRDGTRMGRRGRGEVDRPRRQRRRDRTRLGEGRGGLRRRHGPDLGARRPRRATSPPRSRSTTR